MRLWSFLFFLLFGSSLALAQDNWPDFRGPLGNGHAISANLPLTWSERENIAWKTPIPGLGWSTPVIWDDQIWLTMATDEGKQLHAVCVDRLAGKVVRQIKVFDVAEPEPINALNSYASPSPLIEAGRVYVYFGTYGIACLDTASGEILWSRRDLKLDHKEGPGSSPVLWEDLVIFHCDGQDVQYVIALDKKSGDTAWKANRSVDLSAQRPDFRKAYATPLVAKVEGKPQLISPGAHAAVAYDPQTGRELWTVEYNGFSNIARPLVGHGLVFLNTGYMKPQMLAVRIGGAGNITDSHVAWKHESGVSNKPSPLLVDDLLYFVSDKGGVVTCLEAKAGTLVWNKRLGGNFSASPIYASGRIYFCDQDGKTFVFKPGREYRELAVNELEDGLMASPAGARDSLYLRTKTHLYCVGSGKRT